MYTGYNVAISTLKKTSFGPQFLTLAFDRKQNESTTLLYVLRSQRPHKFNVFLVVSFFHACD